MSTKVLGTSPLLIETDQTFDPRYGFQTRQTYSGTPDTLNTLNGAFTATGIRTRINGRSGRNYLEAYFATDQTPGAAPESPTDFYELETEYYQESVWNNRKVEREAAPFAPPGKTALDVLAFWRSIIENAMKGRQITDFTDTAKPIFEKVKDGPLEPTSLIGFLPVPGLALYELILKDGTAYESSRQILTRTRQISIAYSAKAVAQVQPLVYTTAQLIAEFGIPTAVAERLPADPEDVPIACRWGWKQRRNNSRYEWNGRVPEVMSWTFAAWAGITHEFKS